MKAVIIRSFGGPEVLEIAEQGLFQPGPRSGSDGTSPASSTTSART
jgi:hypothetical protein